MGQRQKSEHTRRVQRNIPQSRPGGRRRNRANHSWRYPSPEDGFGGGIDPIPTLYGGYVRRILWQGSRESNSQERRSKRDPCFIIPESITFVNTQCASCHHG